MDVIVKSEYGLEEALIGLSYNKKQPIDKMLKVADRLAKLDGGHNKFLESIVVYLEVNAPLFWWKQFDTYRIGVSKQSESTMHTILKEPLTFDNFENPFIPEYLNHLNILIKIKDFKTLNNDLPSGFLQRRMICTNYKTLRSIYQQRKKHKLEQWKTFCKVLEESLNKPEWLLKNN